MALLQVRFLPVHEDGAVTGVKVDVRERGVVSLDPQGRAAERVSYLEEGERKFVAGQVVRHRGRALVDSTTAARSAGRSFAVADGGTSPPCASAAPARPSRARIAARCTTGSSGRTATLTDVSPVGASPITALEYMIGNNTFIAGTADGQVSAWFRAPACGRRRLRHGPRR